METTLLIRGLHPYHFRIGEWAELLTTADDPEKGPVYVVRFSDGVTDWWPAKDLLNTYEFSEEERG